MKKIAGWMLSLLLVLSCMNAYAAASDAAPDRVYPKLDELYGEWTGVGASGGDLPYLFIHEDGTMDVYDLPLLFENGELGQMMFHGAFTYDPETGLFTFPSGFLSDQPYHAYLSVSQEDPDDFVNIAEEPIEKGTTMLLFEGTVEQPDLGLYGILAAKMHCGYEPALFPTEEELCASSWVLSADWYNPLATRYADDEGPAYRQLEPKDGLGTYAFQPDGTGRITDADGKDAGTFQWKLDMDRLTLTGGAALNGTYFLQRTLRSLDDELTDDDTDWELVESIYGEEYVVNEEFWIAPDSLRLDAVDADGAITTRYLNRVLGDDAETQAKYFLNDEE